MDRIISVGKVYFFENIYNALFCNTLRPPDFIFMIDVCFIEYTVNISLINRVKIPEIRQELIYHLYSHSINKFMCERRLTTAYLITNVIPCLICNVSDANDEIVERSINKLLEFYELNKIRMKYPLPLGMNPLDLRNYLTETSTIDVSKSISEQVYFTPSTVNSLVDFMINLADNGNMIDLSGVCNKLLPCCTDFAYLVTCQGRLKLLLTKLIGVMHLTQSDVFSNIWFLFLSILKFNWSLGINTVREEINSFCSELPDFLKELVSFHLGLRINIPVDRTCPCPSNVFGKMYSFLISLYKQEDFNLILEKYGNYGTAWSILYCWSLYSPKEARDKISRNLIPRYPLLNTIYGYVFNRVNKTADFLLNIDGFDFDLFKEDPYPIDLIKTVIENNMKELLCLESISRDVFIRISVFWRLCFEVYGAYEFSRVILSRLTILSRGLDQTTPFVMSHIVALLLVIAPNSPKSLNDALIKIFQEDFSQISEVNDTSIGLNLSCILIFISFQTDEIIEKWRNTINELLIMLKDKWKELPSKVSSSLSILNCFTYLSDSVRVVPPLITQFHVLFGDFRSAVNYCIIKSKFSYIFWY